MKTTIKRAITLCLIVAMTAILVISAAGNSPTIRMGDNPPMTRAEFMAWREQKGIRHFNMDGRVYPPGIFFDWGSGQSFSYGELNEGILYVVPRPGVTPDKRIQAVVPIPAAESNAAQERAGTPIIFDGLTPILLSDDELTAMIDKASQERPMDTRSSITLPNRRLTESELNAWITEYNEMGGATAFELAVVRQINRVRTEYGLRPLALSPALMMLKTQEFGDLQYYGHNSLVHGTITEAARMFGFEGFASETLTRSGSSSTPAFRSTPERIVGGMLASTRGHREILLNPNLSSVGFGHFFSPNSTGASGNMTHMFYFAIKFGTAR